MADTNNAVLDTAALLAEIERLKSENATLAATPKHVGRLSFKVSVKGAVSIYGLGRFPVTLYKGQIDRLFSDETVKAVREFVAAHPELKVKE